MRWPVSVLTLITALGVAVMPGNGGPAPAPIRGGALRAAMIGEPPTLDVHWTTATLVSDIMLNVYETLFALDSNFEPKPMLVDRWTMSSDRRTYTFVLRRGVRFHHGRDLTADDVIASISRWGRIAAGGRRVFQAVESLTAPDANTVVIRLREPYSLLPTELAFNSQPAAIYPKDVVDEAGTGQIRRFIGTGPYRFVERAPDRHIRLDRFDGYLSRAEDQDGYAGRREAYFESLYFMPVPDPSTRILGVRRGDFHFADGVPHDEYDRLASDPALTIHTSAAPAALAAVFNKRAGLMANVKIRQAFAAALDNSGIMRATFGNPRLWRLDASLMPKEHPFWTDVGKEAFNVNSPERSRRLLAEAGYNGEPVRWLTTNEFPYIGTSSIVAKTMLEQAGFVVDLQFSDFATIASRRVRPEAYDVFGAAFQVVPDPVFLLYLSPNWPGWYDSRDMQAILALMQRHSDPRVRRDLWARAQRVFYAEMPIAKMGDFWLLRISRRELQGYVIRPGQVWWNAWLMR